MQTSAKPKVKSNMMFQLVYQFIIWGIPLIVSPYLTRTLGADALGDYTYVYSIAYYFVIFADLGILKYGQRLISEKKDNELSLRKSFWSLYINHIISSLIAILAYIVFIWCFVGELKTIFWINALYVFSSMIGTTWFFYGMEDFKGVAARNFIIKIVEIIAIFVLIRSPSDINKYTAIMSVSMVFGNIIMIPRAMSFAKPISVSSIEVKEHIKPLMYFFISVIGITLYTVLDKTLLGALSGHDNVAYYEYSNRIINVPKMLINIIATVLFPRVCNMVKNGQINETKRYMSLSLTVTIALSLGAGFGLSAVSKEFAVIYYGTEFASVGNVMICMAPLIYILTIGDVIRMQYLIPNHKDRPYIICTCLNAAINVVLSVIFIPKYGVYGALIGSIAAEVFGLAFQSIYSRNFISLPDIGKKTAVFSLIGTVMYIILQVLNRNTQFGIPFLCIKIIVGIGVYGILSIVYVFFLSGDKKIFQSIIKKERVE